MFLLSTPLGNLLAPCLREIIQSLLSAPGYGTDSHHFADPKWGFVGSYGGIIYSFSGICQHIFLKIFPITDSVPIIKFFCFTSLAGYLMTPQDPDKKEESGPVIPDKKLLKTVKKLLYKFEKMEYSSSIFF